jgi:hypothetical protein
MSTIAVAAQCERDAESSREEAEASWRAAWWRTSLALAEPSERHLVSEALTEAEEILGQSRSYLLKRRAMGRLFDTQDISRLQWLPPRLSMAWADAHRTAIEVTAEDMEEIAVAEREGVSLRDFAARYDQQFERPAPVTPEAVVQAVRDNPEVAQAIAEDRDARETVEDAGITARAAERPPVPAQLATPAGRADASEGARQRVEGLMGDETDEATNYLQGAASNLGHALFARDRWGVRDTSGEAHALEAVKRLTAMYDAAVRSGHLTEDDKEFLGSIGVTA